MGVLRAIILFLPIHLTILFLNFFQVLSLLLLPISKSLYFKFNGFVGATMWIMYLDILERRDKIKVIFSGDKFKQENAFVISNHQSYTDFVTIGCLACRVGLDGNVRYFVKDSLKYIPGMGWGIYFMRNVQLKRNWMRDQKAINATFADMNELIDTGIPVWLGVYPEGTRITKHKLEESRKFSAERNLPVLDKVIIPRTKGFVAMIQALRGKIQYLYDLTIDYGAEGNLPIFDMMAKDHPGRILRIHVRRIDVSKLPEDEAGLNQWLYKTFEEKDMLMKRVHEKGSFVDNKSNEWSSPPPYNTTKIYFWQAVGIVFWSVVAYYVKTWLF
eukprot:TRINITY_DN2816_c0_g2_i1.p1 TRINITY_DN2816_c0_g2~~TRINITY_DN2816_c0_g2_i1.p1  ORF type:complete len:336 (+),score=92.68 TRINITY_DN2816_c0_g2_i1:23-1009(+)